MYVVNVFVENSLGGVLTVSASDADLQNLFVSFRGRAVTFLAPRMQGERVRLEFSPPLSVGKNQTLKFDLRADVRASRRRTIQFVIEAESDIEAVPYLD